MIPDVFNTEASVSCVLAGVGPPSCAVPGCAPFPPPSSITSPPPPPPVVAFADTAAIAALSPTISTNRVSPGSPVYPLPPASCAVTSTPLLVTTLAAGLGKPSKTLSPTPYAWVDGEWSTATSRTSSNVVNSCSSSRTLSATTVSPLEAYLRRYASSPSLSV